MVVLRSSKKHPTIAKGPLDSEHSTEHSLPSQSLTPDPPLKEAPNGLSGPRSLSQEVSTTESTSSHQQYLGDLQIDLQSGEGLSEDPLTDLSVGHPSEASAAFGSPPKASTPVERLSGGSQAAESSEKSPKMAEDPPSSPAEEGISNEDLKYRRAR